MLFQRIKPAAPDTEVGARRNRKRIHHVCTTFEVVAPLLEELARQRKQLLLQQGLDGMGSGRLRWLLLIMLGM